MSYSDDGHQLIVELPSVCVYLGAEAGEPSLESQALCRAYWFIWSLLLVKAPPFPFLENVRQQKGF